MKKRWFLFIVLSFFVLSSVVLAEEEPILIERFRTDFVKGSYNNGSYSRSSLFANGGATIQSQTADKVTINHYNMNGKKSGSQRLGDDERVLYMEAYGDSLYVLTSGDFYYFYQLNNKMEIVKSIELTGYQFYQDQYYDFNIGLKIFAFAEDYIIVYLPNAQGQFYYINYDLSHFESASDSDLAFDNMIKYFYNNNMYPISYRDPDNRIYDDYVSYDYFENYTIASGKNGNGLPDDNYAVISVFDESGVVWRYKSEDYVKFFGTKLFDDKIVTIGARSYDQNSKDLLSDLLVYSMEGELLETIEINKNLTYLSENDESLVVSISDVDGICGNDKYTDQNNYKYAPSDTGCDVLTAYRVYTLSNKMPVEEEKDTSILPDNPNTLSFSVLSLIILGLASVAIYFISHKKVEFLK